MKPFSRFTAIAVMGTGLIWSAAHADDVVLTSGERFSSDKIWEEKGKIRFNMHGLVVSVQKSDVAAIIRSDDSAHPLEDSPPDTRAPSRKPRPPAPAPAPPDKPLRMAPKSRQSSEVLPTPPAQKTTGNKSGIKGIGFKGISWQMRPTDLPGLSKIKTEEIYGGVDHYWQPDGPLVLGDALLDGLAFGFWQNRLYTIMMWVDGKTGYQQLKRVVFQRYGPGHKSKTRQDRYVWVKDETTDRLLEFDAERNIGIFWMRSRDLDALIKQRYPELTAG